MAVIPPFKDFVTFLIDEDDIANDPVSRAIQTSSSSSSDSRKMTNRSFATGTFEPTSQACAWCGRGHPFHACIEFRKQPYDNRRRVAQERGLCFGCLSPGHLSRNCNNRKICEECGRWHPTGLHPDRVAPGPRQQSDSERPQPNVHNAAPKSS